MKRFYFWWATLPMLALCVTSPSLAASGQANYNPELGWVTMSGGVAQGLMEHLESIHAYRVIHRDARHSDGRRFVCVRRVWTDNSDVYECFGEGRAVILRGPAAKSQFEGLPNLPTAWRYGQLEVSNGAEFFCSRQSIRGEDESTYACVTSVRNGHFEPVEPAIFGVIN